MLWETVYSNNYHRKFVVVDKDGNKLKDFEIESSARNLLRKSSKAVAMYRYVGVMNKRFVYEKVA